MPVLFSMFITKLLSQVSSSSPSSSWKLFSLKIGILSNRERMFTYRVTPFQKELTMQESKHWVTKAVSLVKMRILLKMRTLLSNISIHLNSFTGRPQKPTDLWFSDLTFNSVVIHWTSGYDGGSQQEFMVMKWLEEPGVYIQVVRSCRKWALAVNVSGFFRLSPKKKNPILAVCIVLVQWNNLVVGTY